MEQGTGSLTKGRKKMLAEVQDRQRRRSCTLSSTLRRLPYAKFLVGGEVPGELAVTVVGTNTYVPVPTITSLNRLPAGVTIKC